MDATALHEHRDSEVERQALEELRCDLDRVKAILDTPIMSMDMSGRITCNLKILVPITDDLLHQNGLCQSTAEHETIRVAFEDSLRSAIVSIGVISRQINRRRAAADMAQDLVRDQASINIRRIGMQFFRALQEMDVGQREAFFQHFGDSWSYVSSSAEQELHEKLNSQYDGSTLRHSCEVFFSMLVIDMAKTSPGGRPPTSIEAGFVDGLSRFWEGALISKKVDNGENKGSFNYFCQKVSETFGFGLREEAIVSATRYMLSRRKKNNDVRVELPRRSMVKDVAIAKATLERIAAELTN